MYMWQKRKYLIISILANILLIGALSFSNTTASIASNNLTIQKMAADPNLKGFWLSSKMPGVGRFDHTATLLLDGRVLVVGGLQDRTSQSLGLSSVEIFDPSSRTWNNTDSLNTGRSDHTATLLENGQVLVAGGIDRYQGIALASVEIYDPVSGSWAFAPSLSEPRYGHSATLLPDGKVLIAGGRFSSESSDVLASVELYDPQTETWSATDSLNTPREGHSATLLSNGRVLVVGGYYLGWLGTAEVYDPLSENWQEIPDPIFCHGVAHTATRLLDGRVLVVGGACAGGAIGILREAEIYDPFSSSWEATTSLPTAREAHTATLLPDGTVLIVGGDNGDVPRYSGALIYDPIDDNWMTTGSLSVGRRNHTATLLRNGAVLIVGGWSDTEIALDVTELYIDSIVDVSTPTNNLIQLTNTPIPTYIPASTQAPIGEPVLKPMISNLSILMLITITCLLTIVCITAIIWWISKTIKPKKDDTSFQNR